MKTEYVNPEMRETLGFPFQNGRFFQTRERRVIQARLRKRGNSESVTVVTYSVNLTWSGAGFFR